MILDFAPGYLVEVLSGKEVSGGLGRSANVFSFQCICFVITNTTVKDNTEP